MDALNSSFLGSLLIVLFTCLFIISPSHGQINTHDSTAQIIAYWNKAEQFEYAIKSSKTRITNTDTTTTSENSYDILITVIDSNEQGYVMEWKYSNLQNLVPNPIIDKFNQLAPTFTLRYRTDLMGTFIELLNWEDVRNLNHQALDSLTSNFPASDDVTSFVNQMKNMYNSKETMESFAIRDIQQYHTFHGAKYKLSEYMETTFQSPNIYGAKPFDSHLIVYLDEINPEEHEVVVRAKQIINQEQLIDATYIYLSQLAKSLNQDVPDKNLLLNLTNETETGSRIHDSGWLIYSFQTTTVNSQGTINIENRIIEIK